MDPSASALAELVSDSSLRVTEEASPVRSAGYEPLLIARGPAIPGAPEPSRLALGSSASGLQPEAGNGPLAPQERLDPIILRRASGLDTRPTQVISFELGSDREVRSQGKDRGEPRGCECQSSLAGGWC